MEFHFVGNKIFYSLENQIGYLGLKQFYLEIKKLMVIKKKGVEFFDKDRYITACFVKFGLVNLT